MLNLLKRLFTRPSTSPASDESLALQAEMQSLRLALEEAGLKIARLESELARQQRDAESSREAAIQGHLQAVFSELAGPAAQFLLQLDLADTSARSLQARDTLAVARNLLRTLQNHGLEISEPAGMETPFDPALHESLSTSDLIQAGQMVRVRLPSLSYRGQRLRKAGVTLLASPRMEP